MELCMILFYSGMVILSMGLVGTLKMARQDEKRNKELDAMLIEYATLNT